MKHRAPLAAVLVPLVAAGCQTTDSRSDPPAASTTSTADAALAAPSERDAFSGKHLSLERIFSDPPLAGRPPSGLQISPDGTRLTFLRPNEEDSEILDLWALELPNGAPQPLVRTRDLVDTSDIRLTEEERMALERKRVRHSGITSYAFCGDEGNTLLFPLSGDLYHVALGAAGEAPKVRRLTKDGRGKLDPKCSPGGNLVSFTRDRDLFVVDVESGKERRLTKSDAPTRSFGVAEFIAQEEMGRYEGAFWSDGERYLAFTEVDESPVGVQLRPFIYADRTEMYEQRYPAAGEANAKVRVHVEDLKTKRRVTLALPGEDGYVARVGFADEGVIYVQWQSRDQKRLVLLAGEAPRFALKPVLEETDEAWVELHDDLRFFADGKRFIWSSERDGVKHLYLGERGKPGLARITSGSDPVVELVALLEDEGRVLYTRATSRSLERQLFSAKLDGSDERRLTEEPGTHQISRAGDFLVDRFSRFGVPPKIRLLSITGEVVRVVDDNPAEELSGYARSEPSFLTVPAPDGTELNALLLPPVGMREGERYPVIVYVYGGPTAQLVANGYTRNYPFFVHLNQRGYGVFVVDNRGTGYRDRAFTRAFKDRFGQVEIEDQMHAAREVLAKTPWVDSKRVGIFGWSYGGYVSALSILQEETPFRAAVSVAPVTDWSLYDTHYTERYIGTPKDNAEVYARSSVLPLAENLAKGERALFLVHGMADDNVLFTHSLKLMEAFQQKGVPFDFMAYPGRAHGLTGKETQLHVYRSIVAFFDRELKR